MITYCDGESGREIVQLTREQANLCPRQGECIEYIVSILGAVKWLADDALLRRMLDGYGAWDDLETADQKTLRTRALWTACCDINETPEDYPEDET